MLTTELQAIWQLRHNFFGMAFFFLTSSFATISYGFEGGQPADPSIYPGLVLINADFRRFSEFGGSYEDRKVRCTGVMISPNQVSTTTACTTFETSDGIGNPSDEIVPRESLYVYPIDQTGVPTDISPSSPGNIRVSEVFEDSRASRFIPGVLQYDDIYSLVVLNLPSVV